MKDSREKLEIGKIVGVHGIKGDVKIYPWSDDASELLLVKRFFWEDGTESKLKELRIHKNIILAKIEGVNSPEVARGYIDKIILVERSEIKLKEGQFLVVDLIGLLVVDGENEGLVYGRVCDVIKTGANDVYSVKDDNGKEFLVPVIKSVVKSVDLEQKKIKITPIKGLFGNED